MSRSEFKDAIRVLHIDDEPDELIVAKRYLEEVDPAIQLESVTSPEEAQQRLQKQSFDCIVSDYQMPGMNGIELAQRVKERSSTPFVLYTGRGSEEVASTAFEAGVDDYVRKEFEPSHYQVLAKRVRMAAEKHWAEGRLRESEEKFRGIAERSFDIIYTMDAEGSFTYVSPAIERVLGFKPEDIVGRPLQELASGPEFLQVVQALTRVRDGETIEGLQVEMKRRDRASAFLEVNASPIIKDGEVVGSEGIVRDVTQRKKKDEELVRLSNAVKMSTDSIVISDLEGKIIDVNEATLKMYGTEDKGDLVGKNSFDFIAPEDQEEALAGLKETLEKGYVTGREYHVVIKDGSKIPVEMNSAIMKDLDGKTIGFVGITRDITERKKAEVALRESEERYRSLAGDIPDFVITVDPDYKILRINRGVPGLVTVEQAIGTEVYNYVEHAHHEIMKESLDKVFRTGKSEKFEVLGIGHQGPNTAWYEIRVSPNKVADGQVISATLISTDITEHKRMEEELRQYSEHLEILVNERSRELLDKERMAAAGKIATMLGHDLRAPLQTIRSALEIIRESPEKRAHELDRAEGAVARAVEMLEEFRRRTRDTPLKVSATDLAALIRRAVEEASKPASVAVTLELGDGLDAAPVDHLKMLRLLDNLILNAVEAMPKGGTLTVNAGRYGDDIVVRVRDTGVGIPEEEMPNLFKPFHTTKTRGLGLGLAYCKRVAIAHGGTITAESKVGKGTTFTIAIPALEAN